IDDTKAYAKELLEQRAALKAAGDGSDAALLASVEARLLEVYVARLESAVGFESEAVAELADAVGEKLVEMRRLAGIEQAQGVLAPRDVLASVLDDIVLPALEKLGRKLIAGLED